MALTPAAAGVGRYFSVIPFAANVSRALGDTRNLIKRSPISGCGALVISAAVNGMKLWSSPGNGPRSFIPGVVAISGIVPAAISFPLPFSTGAKISFGAVRTIFGLSVSAIPKRSTAAANTSPDFTVLTRLVSPEQGSL